MNARSHPALRLTFCTLLFGLPLAGCATAPPAHQTAAASQPWNDPASAEEAQAAAVAGHPPPAETADALEAGPDPLLVGLRADDLAWALALAKRDHLPHWPRIAERSRLTRARVLEEIRRLNAPESLQAVPVVESGYNPYALSPAGAMGLWQLMPGTARFLGARGSREIDARRHVRAATDAAVRYLLQLRERFGNWPLALAAYHRGPAAIARRLRRHPWRPVDGIRAMPVPAVTRSYVLHVLGTAAMLRTGIVRFPDPLETREVTLNAPVDLTTLARAAGMEPRDFFLLNPGLNQAQCLHGEIVVHVPEERAEVAAEAARKAGPRYVRYRVQPGDSLWQIARRHGIGVQRLRRLNPGLRRVLSVGQTLKVPANRLARASAAPNPLLSQGRRIRYKVRGGDSLWRIARRFGTTPRAIARANSLRPDAILRPGDTLWVLARIRPG
ncbi:MAG: LysM peptidoglycan-binding domain-containing protein [Mariprofundaceae bacterium]